MKTSQHGITLIEQREGIRYTVYLDSKGIPTVGVGHVVLPGDNLRVGDKITPAQCDAFLAKDLGSAEYAVNTAVHVPLAPNQFDALVSFTVNIGVNGFNGSSVVRRLNARDYAGAATAMMNWVTPPEITGRRRTEQKQFLTPYPVSAAAPAEDASPNPSTSDVNNAIQNPPDLGPPPINDVDNMPSTPLPTENGGLLARASAYGDRLQSWHDTFGKLNPANYLPTMPSSAETKLSVIWKQVILPGLSLVTAWFTGHWWECAAVAGICVIAGSAEWAYSRYRNNPKEAVPAGMIKDVAATQTSVTPATAPTIQVTQTNEAK